MSRARAGAVRRRLASASRNASSMRAVTFEWDAAASFLIWVMSSSGRLMVVLMHQSILLRHIDVNSSLPRRRGVRRMFKKAVQRGRSKVRDAKNNERHVCGRRRGGEPAVPEGEA